MSNNELIAIENFAEKLKVDFPILERPQTLMDKMANIQNEYLHRLIDSRLEDARIEFNLQAEQEAKHYGN